jgi:hypothetical protein
MRGALESALHRTQTGHCSAKLQVAAAALHSLVQDDPFLDGMSAMVFAVVSVFLRINACKVAAGSSTIGAFALELFEAKAYDTDDWVPGMRTHVWPRSSRAWSAVRGRTVTTIVLRRPR